MTQTSSEDGRRRGGSAGSHDVVRWRDLDLSRALRALGGEAAPGEGDRTAQLQRLIDRLCALSMQDPLTGLFNRRYFDHRLAQELARARRERVPCSLVLLDIDHFKRVNDRHGHAAGDLVLAHLGRVLGRELRTADTLTRVGGEELAVILPCTGLEAAVGVAERLRRAVNAAPVEREGAPITITISAGVASAEPGEAIEPKEIFCRADRALYAAKAAGRNRVRADARGAGEREGVGPAEKKALTT